jgi:hypothetical protein
MFAQLAVTDSFRGASKDDRAANWASFAGPLAGALGGLTQLTALNLTGWALGESVTSLRRLTRLRSLNLADTQQSDASLSGVLPALCLLTQLSLAQNTHVTRAPLAAVDLLQPELQALNVCGCEGIRRDVRFMQWVQRQPQLTVSADP